MVTAKANLALKQGRSDGNRQRAEVAVTSSPTGDKTNQANRTNKDYITGGAGDSLPFHVLLRPPKVRPECV